MLEWRDGRLARQPGGDARRSTGKFEASNKTFAGELTTAVYSYRRWSTYRTTCLFIYGHASQIRL